MAPSALRGGTLLLLVIGCCASVIFNKGEDVSYTSPNFAFEATIGKNIQRVIDLDSDQSVVVLKCGDSTVDVKGIKLNEGDVLTSTHSCLFDTTPGSSNYFIVRSSVPSETHVTYVIQPIATQRFMAAIDMSLSHIVDLRTNTREVVPVQQQAIVGGTTEERTAAEGHVLEGLARVKSNPFDRFKDTLFGLSQDVLASSKVLGNRRVWAKEELRLSGGSAVAVCKNCTVIIRDMELKGTNLMKNEHSFTLKMGIELHGTVKASWTGDASVAVEVEDLFHKNIILPFLAPMNIAVRVPLLFTLSSLESSGELESTLNARYTVTATFARSGAPTVNLQRINDLEVSGHGSQNSAGSFSLGPRVVISIADLYSASVQLSSYAGTKISTFHGNDCGAHVHAGVKVQTAYEFADFEGPGQTARFETSQELYSKEVDCSNFISDEAFVAEQKHGGTNFPQTNLAAGTSLNSAAQQIAAANDKAQSVITGLNDVFQDYNASVEFIMTRCGGGGGAAAAAAMMDGLNRIGNLNTTRGQQNLKNFAARLNTQVRTQMRTAARVMDGLADIVGKAKTADEQRTRASRLADVLTKGDQRRAAVLASNIKSVSKTVSGLRNLAVLLQQRVGTTDKTVAEMVSEVRSLENNLNNLGALSTQLVQIATSTKRSTALPSPGDEDEAADALGEGLNLGILAIAQELVESAGETIRARTSLDAIDYVALAERLNAVALEKSVSLGKNIPQILLNSINALGNLYAITGNLVQNEVTQLLNQTSEVALTGIRGALRLISTLGTNLQSKKASSTAVAGVLQSTLSEAELASFASALNLFAACQTCGAAMSPILKDTQTQASLTALKASTAQFTALAALLPATVTNITGEAATVTLLNQFVTGDLNATRRISANLLLAKLEASRAKANGEIVKINRLSDLINNREGMDTYTARNVRVSARVIAQLQEVLTGISATELMKVITGLSTEAYSGLATAAKVVNGIGSGLKSKSLSERTVSGVMVATSTARDRTEVGDNLRSVSTFYSTLVGSLKGILGVEALVQNFNGIIANRSPINSLGSAIRSSLTATTGEAANIAVLNALASGENIDLYDFASRIPLVASARAAATKSKTTLSSSTIIGLLNNDAARGSAALAQVGGIVDPLTTTANTVANSTDKFTALRDDLNDILGNPQAARDFLETRCGGNAAAAAAAMDGIGRIGNVNTPGGQKRLAEFVGRLDKNVNGQLAKAGNVVNQLGELVQKAKTEQDQQQRAAIVASALSTADRKKAASLSASLKAIYSKTNYYAKVTAALNAKVGAQDDGNAKALLDSLQVMLKQMSGLKLLADALATTTAQRTLVTPPDMDAVSQAVGGHDSAFSKLANALVFLSTKGDLSADNDNSNLETLAKTWNDALSSTSATLAIMVLPNIANAFKILQAWIQTMSSLTTNFDLLAMNAISSDVYKTLADATNIVNGFLQSTTLTPKTIAGILGSASLGTEARDIGDSVEWFGKNILAVQTNFKGMAYLQRTDNLNTVMQNLRNTANAGNAMFLISQALIADTRDNTNADAQITVLNNIAAGEYPKFTELLPRLLAGLADSTTSTSTTFSWRRVKDIINTGSAQEVSASDAAVLYSKIDSLSLSVTLLNNLNAVGNVRKTDQRNLLRGFATGLNSQVTDIIVRSVASLTAVDKLLGADPILWSSFAGIAQQTNRPALNSFVSGITSLNSNTAGLAVLSSFLAPGVTKSALDSVRGTVAALRKNSAATLTTAQSSYLDITLASVLVKLTMIDAASVKTVVSSMTPNQLSQKGSTAGSDKYTVTGLSALMNSAGITAAQQASSLLQQFDNGRGQRRVAQTLSVRDDVFIENSFNVKTLTIEGQGDLSDFKTVSRRCGINGAAESECQCDNGFKNPPLCQPVKESVESPRCNGDIVPTTGLKYCKTSNGFACAARGRSANSIEAEVGAFVASNARGVYCSLTVARLLCNIHLPEVTLAGDLVSPVCTDTCLGALSQCASGAESQETCSLAPLKSCRAAPLAQPQGKCIVSKGINEICSRPSTSRIFFYESLFQSEVDLERYLRTELASDAAHLTNECQASKVVALCQEFAPRCRSDTVVGMCRADCFRTFSSCKAFDLPAVDQFCAMNNEFVSQSATCNVDASMANANDQISFISRNSNSRGPAWANIVLIGCGVSIVSAVVAFSVFRRARRTTEVEQELI